MDTCSIWCCKHKLRKTRFYRVFWATRLSRNCSRPKRPFSGKAPPCGPRPLRLICNFRWTPSHEDRVGVVKPALEPERLEAGVGVAQDPTEGIIVEALRNIARLCVHNKPHRTLVVCDDAVGDAIASVACDRISGARRTNAPPRQVSAAASHPSTQLPPHA